ncbi:hypothetical protein ACFYY8_36905 [Streptosporangium sp. NPDC001559]|uniref:hypothetical protein n=1 Tax=Streptosporangium sp. NPDC001559 TaxID=3366187 RepID=UPI0036F027AC
MAEVSAGTLAEMLNERRHLIEIALWMLGSEPMADRIVQETYRRWYTLDDAERGAITVPRAWLTKVAGGICLELLATPAPAPVLPEHVALPGAPAPALGYGPVPGPAPIPVSGQMPAPCHASTSAPGRMPVPGPAPIPAPVHIPVPGPAPIPVSGHAPQSDIVVPARRSESAADPEHRPEPVNPARPPALSMDPGSRRTLPVGSARPQALAEHDRVVRRFAQLWDLGDVTALREILAVDVTAVSDGGGNLRAAVHPVHGADAVACFVVALLTGQSGTEVTAGSVNGRTGLVLRQAGQAVAVVGMSVAGARVTAVWIVLNPDKLRPWHRPPPREAYR